MMRPGQNCQFLPIMGFSSSGYSPSVPCCIGVYTSEIPNKAIFSSADMNWKLGALTVGSLTI